jgi:hypothetical protein
MRPDLVPRWAGGTSEMRIVLVLGLAAILVAGCVGSGAASPDPSETPSSSPQSTVDPSPSIPGAAPSVPASPTPSPMASPTESVSPPSGSAGLSFERVATVDDTELYAAAAFDGGFVVGGCRLRLPSSESDYGGCVEAVVMFSPDGRTWTDTVVPGSAGMQVLGFSDTPLGLLALGSKLVDHTPGERAIWRSNDGIHWEPFAMSAPPAIVFDQAFVLAGRTVLIGSDTNFDFSVQTEAWATNDGRTWTRGETPMYRKVAGTPGVVAIGDGCVDICPDDLPTLVARSADGLAWVDGTAPSEAGSFGPLGTWAGRAVVAGTVDRDAAVWFDGPTGWRLSRLPSGAGQVVYKLIDADDRLIALTRTEDVRLGLAWWTSDGRTWERGAVGGLAQDDSVAAWAGSHPLLIVVDYDSLWLSVD